MKKQVKNRFGLVSVNRPSEIIADECFILSTTQKYKFINEIQNYA